MATEASREGPARPRRSGRARREEDREARLQAILAAALDVFSERGYAATRLEDVAARAGVAKGTVYLYVSSKQALFEALVRSQIVLPIEAVQGQMLSLDAPAETLLRLLLRFMRRELLGTRRRDVVRLVLSEAGRFPEIAEFYHREVVARGMALLRGVAERAVERGEFRSDALARFPQLFVAPMLLAVVWDGLFERLDPLDAEGMLEAHLELLLRGLREGTP